MPSELPEEFRDAWRRWAEDAFAAAAAGGGGGGGGGRAVASAQDTFIRGLLQNNNAGNTAKGGGGGGGGGGGKDGVDAGEDGDEGEAKDSWELDDDDDDGAKKRDIAAAADKKKASDARSDAAFAATSERLKRDAAAKRDDPAWRKMFAFRQNLPVAALRDDLLHALSAGDAAVVGLYKLNPVVTRSLKPPGFNS
jgi:hypothetical protein